MYDIPKEYGVGVLLTVKSNWVLIKPKTEWYRTIVLRIRDPPIYSCTTSVLFTVNMFYSL